MSYQLRVTDPNGAYQVEYVYPDGRVQVVSPTQDLYTAWLAEGNTPATLPYVAPPPPPAPAPIPTERTTLYAEMFALYATSGQTTPPATYEDAIAALTAWVDAAPDADTKVSRLTTTTILLTKRMQLMEMGGSWSEALAYLATQP